MSWKVQPSHPESPSLILTINLTDTQGNLIATASRNHTFEGVEYLNVFFDQPYRLTAGQDYIAATMVYVPPATYPPFLKYVKAINLTQCGPGNTTVIFSSASKQETDDSNGSKSMKDEYQR